jgi:hypothetical protein
MVRDPGGRGSCNRRAARLASHGTPVRVEHENKTAGTVLCSEQNAAMAKITLFENDPMIRDRSAEGDRTRHLV